MNTHQSQDNNPDTALWECKHCGLYNHHGNTKCKACFYYKPQNQIISHAKSNNKEIDERKYRSTLLVFGYTRKIYQNTQILPKDIIQLFHDYYFQQWQGIWSSKHKGKYMKLSEDNSKCTSSEYYQSCRGRDPINKGMKVEWTMQYDIGSGITIGVIKSGDNINYNDSADSLPGCYGIDNCSNTIYYGENYRHVGIRPDMPIEYFDKPRLRSHNTSERVKMICDYTGEKALITYEINGKMCKPKSQDYTWALPKINENECWYMHVDFESVPAWCKVVEYK